jgi:hypothetical protein
MLNQQTQNVLESLAHFTYDLTKGEMVVLDLRPINITQHKILITEPVIYSIMPDRFSSSDLGANGIESFKRQHTFNLICQRQLENLYYFLLLKFYYFLLLKFYYLCSEIVKIQIMVLK